MTPSPVLTTGEAQQRQCPYRQFATCCTTSCMAWCTTAKHEGYCLLLQRPAGAPPT